MQVPLRVYSADGALMAEFAEMKRTPLEYAQFPQHMLHAVLAAEDDRFFEHPGVDYQGILRAAFYLVTTGEKGQGGSTITMQVARNFLIGREKTYTRKINEILLSLKIEEELSKEEILTLYLNKIFLGHRSYGVAAAAQVYYGKELSDLTIEQFAMIAGLPKAPSAYNPIANPDRALLRRNYVLRRMNELGYITDEEFDVALNTPDDASLYGVQTEIDAPFVAEMVRDEMLARYGKEAYTAGYNVYTTLQTPLQTAANMALHNNLRDYEMRHGYKGALAQVELPEQAGAKEWATALKEVSSPGGLVPALVIGLAEQSAALYLKDNTLQLLAWDGMKWASSYVNDNAIGAEPKKASDILKVGDVIYVDKDTEGNWLLAQVPEVSSALVSLNPNNGALLALVGGFDYYQSKFNRVTQAKRQPGSNFKPFIYSAALEYGFTPASLINDAPVVFEDNELEGEWRPENYSGKFYGPTRLRMALVKSRNLVSIRLLQSIGIRNAIKYISNFGFDPKELSRDLSLALGSATITPYKLAQGYSVFANGGYLVEPYFIDRIEDAQGNILFQADPVYACEPQQCPEKPRLPSKPVENQQADMTSQEESNTSTVTAAETVPVTPPAPPQRYSPAPRVLDPRNVYLITSILQDVIREGTGKAALSLGRTDLAGKTGTTNDQQDAWFSGFNKDVVTTAWVGFDNPRSMGYKETGAHAALPMWISYMREALKNSKEAISEQPEGILSARIDSETGEFTSADNPNAIFELFRAEDVPAPTTEPLTAESGGGNLENNSLTGELF